MLCPFVASAIMVVLLSSPQLLLLWLPFCCSFFLILVLTLRHSAALIWRHTHVPRAPIWTESPTRARYRARHCRCSWLIIVFPSSSSSSSLIVSPRSDLFEIDKTFVKLRKLMSSTNLLAVSIRLHWCEGGQRKADEHFVCPWRSLRGGFYSYRCSNNHQ